MDHTTLFLQDTPLKDHHQAQGDARPAYVAALLLLLAHRVDLSPAARARALAAAWARRDDELSALLLARPEWDLTAVARAVQLLDAGRQARALRRRIERLEAEGRIRPQRLGRLRSRLCDLTREGEVGSLSGALARKIRRWVRAMPGPKLEYYAMTFPLLPWRSLADLCHLAPADFQLPWFQPVAFGGEPPADSMMAACAGASAAELPQVARRFQAPYSSLRTRLPAKGAQKDAPAELRSAVAAYESLDTLLWYYEELRCTETDQRIDALLREDASALGLGYGKLMERLFACRDLKAPFWERLLPAAERTLGQLQLPIDAPVVVLGDASSSMTVAIRVATIIGSLLALLARADLRFFNQALIAPPKVPRSIADVLQVTDAIRAEGSTAPAAALWPSLKRGEPVRSFVVVTDEEENTACQGQRFGEMLARYHKECHAAQVVFISFIGQTAAGQMAADLKARGLPYRQFRLDRQRPDLTKLDEILGHLSISGGLFQERLETVSGWAAAARLAALPERVAALITPADPEAPGAEPGAAPSPGLWQRLRSLLGG